MRRLKVCVCVCVPCHVSLSYGYLLRYFVHHIQRVILEEGAQEGDEWGIGPGRERTAVFHSRQKRP